MDRAALLKHLRAAKSGAALSAANHRLMQAAAEFIERNTAADEDGDVAFGIEIRLGDGVQLVKFMLGLRSLQREIAEDEPETARRIGELIDEWEKTK